MKISFLASHGGSTAKHIIAAINAKQLDAETGLLVTNNRDSEIYRWCLENSIQVSCINGQTHPIEKHKDEAIYSLLKSAGTDFIVLSGYMKKIGPVTLSGYSNRILNIHPSLLPRHGGQGLYGDKVHESVLKSGDKLSGATVQFVNEEYDRGPIIARQTVEVVEGETLESLKIKVQALEGALCLNSLRQIVSSC